MPAARDLELLVKAARLYFQDGASQQEIAEVLGVSRSNVSRMLASARQRRIVEIKINDPSGRDLGLEDELNKRLGLVESRVASYQPGLDTTARVGELAAHWLLANLTDVSTIGLSWGTALQSMVWATSTQTAHPVEVVPLVGGLSALKSEASGQELVRELADRLGASYRYLHAPAIMGTSKAAAALMGEPSVAEALTFACSADIAFVGVGACGHGSSQALMDQLNLGAREISALRRQNPVGDVCARFFDRDGNGITGPAHDRVLAIELDDLRRIPRVVGVARGVEKAPGVQGAVRGGLINVLICDSSLARALLRAETDPRKE